MGNKFILRGSPEPVIGPAKPDPLDGSALRMTHFSGTSRRRGQAVEIAGAGGRDRQSAVGVFVQLVAQRADRDAEDIGGMGAIAEAMLQRLQDQIAFYVGDCTSDQSA